MGKNNFLIQFQKTEKFVTQLFVQKHSSVLGIRDHAFFGFISGFTHQHQGAELELTTNRQDQSQPYNERYKFYDFHRTPKNFELDSHQEKSKLLRPAQTASPVIQISLGSESLLIFRPRKLRVAKVVAKCSKVLKCPEIL